jgi:hypothetical protein
VVKGSKEPVPVDEVVQFFYLDEQRGRIKDPLELPWKLWHKTRTPTAMEDLTNNILNKDQ